MIFAHDFLRDELAEIYRGYIDCLNKQDWASLIDCVHDAVRYNGILVGLVGYRTMLQDDYRAIPDLSFTVDLLICDPAKAQAKLGWERTVSFPELVTMMVDSDLEQLRQGQRFPDLSESTSVRVKH